MWPLFRLLDPLGVVGLDLVGIYCEAAGASIAIAEPSTMISVKMSNMLFFFAVIRVTLVAAASNSISRSYESSC